jgi:hypothetical protein
MKIVKLHEVRKQAERTKYKDMALAAFDALSPKQEQRKQAGKPQRLDTDEEVRRKAKQQL